MKTISNEQSCGNSARRERRMKARHARAGRWRTRPKPVFGSGKVRHEVGARINAMSRRGTGVVRRLVSKPGLDGEINRRLKLLKRHPPYHEPDHVLNVRRNEAADMDALGAAPIPSPAAAGDFTRRYDEADMTELMEGIDTVRPHLWRGRGRDLPVPVARVDADGTLVPTRGTKKEGMDISHNGGCGATTRSSSRWPTRATCRTWSTGWATRSATRARRSGPAGPSHSSRRMFPALCVRGDTAFSLTVNFDRWSEKADFIFGHDAQPTIVKRAEALKEQGGWKRLERGSRSPARPGKTRGERVGEKGRIVRERGYVNSSASATRSCMPGALHRLRPPHHHDPRRRLLALAHARTGTRDPARALRIERPHHRAHPSRSSAISGVHLTPLSPSVKVYKS